MIIKHYRTEKHGSVSIAYKSVDGLSEIGISWCSPKDKFNRKKGRLIAEGRLEKKRTNGHYYAQAYPEDLRPSKQIFDMLDVVKVPCWFGAFEIALRKKWEDAAPRQN